MTYVLVGIGGMFGALCRHLMIVVFAARSTSFPFATLMVNLLGCFLMGMISEIFALKVNLPAEVKLLLTTGFLGAFTTFSTFSLDIVSLVGKSSVFSAVAYAALSVVLGILCVYAAMLSVRFLLQ